MVVNWRDLPRWDIKTARASAFRLAHPDFRPLGDFAKESTELVRPWDDPEKEWAVYGVNNEVGVVFSHSQRGSTFNAPYKRIQKDWFFHNPTRANVGSLGRVPDVPADAITSPEYQVWRVTDAMLPAFAEVLIQANFFMEQIACHRVGAVKERLFVQNLLEIPVPVLGLPVQRKIVAAWKAARKFAADTAAKIEQLEREIETRLLADLGLKARENVVRPKVFSLRWSEISRWGVELAWREQQQPKAFKYDTKSLGEICQTGTGGTPTRKRPEFFGGGIPWVKTTEVRNNVITATEETLSKEGLANCQAKLYPVGSIVMAMYGQGATRGRTAKLGIKATTNQACLVMTDFVPRLLNDFVWFYLMARYEDIRGLASGNNQPNLSAELVRAFPVPLPPESLQRKMIERTTAQRAEIAKLKADAATRADAARADVEAMILGTKPVR
jgi:hypothetical protein